MALTKAQQAQLDALEAEKNKPEPRTNTGLAGVLHTILDVLAGDVPHLGAETWAALHTQVETEHGDQAPAEEAPAEEEKPSSSSSSSGGKDKAGKA